MANSYRGQAKRRALDARERRRLAAEKERNRDQAPQVFSGRAMGRPGNRDRVVALEERTGRSVADMDVAAMLKDPEARSLVADLSRPGAKPRKTEGGSEE